VNYARKTMKKALFLAGGGARGAYQAGALKGISDILQVSQLPFQIISSLSVGAINASFLAMYADNFPLATTKLVELWSSLKTNQIFKISNSSLAQSVLRNLFNILFNRKIRGGQYLLDTAPLKELLSTTLNFHQVNANIERGLLEVFEVGAVCYDRSDTVSFYRSHQPQVEWRGNRQLSQATHIGVKHILASSAVPLFFPAVEIDSLHYGDGGLRNTVPLRASVRFGADAILIIGTRRMPTLNLMPTQTGNITFAKILSNMLDAAFLDNIDQNMSLLNTINRNIELIPDVYQEKLSLRKIDLLYLHPDADLGKLAEKKRKAMPFLLRYLMNAFGTKGQSSDLLSFLLFEGDYCKEVVALGYDDIIKHAQQIKAFFAQ
jgi:NTE family protein